MAGMAGLDPAIHVPEPETSRALDGVDARVKPGRVLQPARVGGADLGLGTLVDICRELALACPSTAWNLGHLAGHHWKLGYSRPPRRTSCWTFRPTP